MFYNCGHPLELRNLHGMPFNFWRFLKQLHDWLVVWNMAFMTFHILGMSSSQLTNSIIFQRGRAQPATSHDFGRFFPGYKRDERGPLWGEPTELLSGMDHQAECSTRGNRLSNAFKAVFFSRFLLRSWLVVWNMAFMTFRMLGSS